MAAATHVTAIGPPVRRSDGWRTAAAGALCALSAYSTGVAWQAQAVSYPLFAQVSEEDFAAYHLAYNVSIPLVVIVPGFLTFLGCAAYPWLRPAGFSSRLAWLVSGCGLGSLLSTVAWAIPKHDALDRLGQDPATLSSLMQANAVRSVLLTVGTVALLAGLVRVARPRH